MLCHLIIYEIIWKLWTLCKETLSHVQLGSKKYIILEIYQYHVSSQVGNICISQWWRIGTIGSKDPLVALNGFEEQLIKDDQSILFFSSVFFTAVKYCLFSTTKCDVNRPFGADNLSQLNVGPCWLIYSQAVGVRLEREWSEFGFEHRHPDNSRWIVFCG